MRIELNIRLQAYAAMAEARVATDPSLYADALSSSAAAAASVSASTICSHTRILRGDSPPPHLLPGQHELDLLIADTVRKPGHADETATPDAGPRRDLPLTPGRDTLEKLALGASAIPAIKEP